MIITLTEAQLIDSSLTKDDLIGLEVAIREITNNNFQNTRVRFGVAEIIEPNEIRVNGSVRGLRVGDRIELNNSDYNENLHTVGEIDGNVIKTADGDLLAEKQSGMIVTLVRYPQDVKNGVKKILDYEKKTAKNLGVKSRSIARVSEIYFDVTAAENVNGYPTALLSFIKKYRKMRWGN